jgi:putative oxidoreductase
MNQPDLNLSIAELFVRFFLGVLFVFQGFDKLFIVKIKNVISAFQNEAGQKNVPRFLVAFTSYFTSITEFIGGLLLLLGLFHHASYIILCFNLVVVAIAFSFLKPMWDMHHVFPRVILLVLVLVLSQYFYFGLDTLFIK